MSAYETSIDRLWKELIEGLSCARRSRVIRCRNTAVMTATVLQREMTVQHLGIGPQPGSFVDTLSLVNQLVTCEAVHATHIPPHKGEYAPVQETISVFILEEEGVIGALQRIYPTDYKETPYPVNCIVDYKDVDR